MSPSISIETARGRFPGKDIWMCGACGESVNQLLFVSDDGVLTQK